MNLVLLEKYIKSRLEPMLQSKVLPDTWFILEIQSSYKHKKLLIRFNGSYKFTDKLIIIKGDNYIELEGNLIKELDRLIKDSK